MAADTTITSEVFPIRGGRGDYVAHGVRVLVDGRMHVEITAFRTFMEAFDAGETVVAELVAS